MLIEIVFVATGVWFLRSGISSRRNLMQDVEGNAALVQDFFILTKRIDRHPGGGYSGPSTSYIVELVSREDDRHDEVQLTVNERAFEYLREGYEVLLHHLPHSGMLLRVQVPGREIPVNMKNLGSAGLIHTSNVSR